MNCWCRRLWRSARSRKSRYTRRRLFVELPAGCSLVESLFDGIPKHGNQAALSEHREKLRHALRTSWQ